MTFVEKNDIEDELITLKQLNNTNGLKNPNDIDYVDVKKDEEKDKSDKPMRSLSFINPDLYTRIQNTISLQSILSDINEVEIDENVLTIESLDFFSNEYNFTILIRNIAFMSIFRPLFIITYSKLIKKILSQIKNVQNKSQTQITRYQFIVLSELFHYIFISDEVNCFNSFLHLTYHLYEQEVFTAIEIIAIIKRYFKKYILSRASISSVFAMFAPEIEACDSILFGKMLSFIETWVSEQIFSPKATKFFKTFDEYKANDYKKLREMRSSVSCNFLYFDIFINDDIEELRTISSDPKFHVDLQIESPFLSPFYFLTNEYSLLSCAASFGAVECFKYLLQNGANYNHKANTTQIPQYSMIGGSIEIIRICEQFNMNFEGSLQSSATFYRNEIFEYLYETKYSNLMEVSPTKAIVILQAATSNNLELMLNCLEMNCDANQQDEFEMNCLKRRRISVYQKWLNFC